MTEHERADRLARAVDAMIQGRRPESLDDQELEELLLIASIRRDFARTSARVGAEHEATVWRKIMARLKRGQAGAGDSSADPTEDVPLRTPLSGGPSDHDVMGPEEVGGLLNRAVVRAAPRRRVEERSVWRRGQGAKLGLNRLIWEGGESGPPAPVRLVSALGAASSDLWQRLGPKIAVAGAAAALLVAALGPIATTGLADHPVARVVRLVSEGAGLSGAGAPAVLPSDADFVSGIDVTVGEASGLLGLPIGEPTSLPSGFSRVASTYFSRALTAEEGGVHLLAYAAEGRLDTVGAPTILIYQERASGDDIAVLEGFAVVRILSDGSSATYVRGSWRIAGSQLVWGDEDAQSLIFERAGLRTIIHAVAAPALGPVDLQAVADSMQAVAVP